jgi:hypothetical protein
MPVAAEVRPIAFSSDVEIGSRQESASQQKIRAMFLIPSEAKWP